MSWLLADKPINRVLISRLRYLGDIVMSTVLIRALRMGAPELEIGYLCESTHADVLLTAVGLDRIHALDVSRYGSDARARETVTKETDTKIPDTKNSATNDSTTIPLLKANTWQTIQDLKSCKYDLAVDLFFNPRSAWLLRLSGIKYRIGGTRKLRRHLYTHTVIRSEMTTENVVLERLAPGGLGEHLCRLEALVHAESGLPFFEWLDKQSGDKILLPQIDPPRLSPGVAAQLATLGVGHGQPYLLLSPGATWPSKQWPVDNWSLLIQKLQTEYDLPVVILQPPGKQAQWQPLSSRFNSGRGGMLEPMPLVDALAVVGHSSGIVCADGGIMHAAVGMQVPTLALFGPTDPDIWFPYETGGPFKVLTTRAHCSPCNLLECQNFICLPQLLPEAVINAMKQLMQ